MIQNNGLTKKPSKNHRFYVHHRHKNTHKFTQGWRFNFQKRCNSDDVKFSENKHMEKMIGKRIPLIIYVCFRCLIYFCVLIDMLLLFFFCCCCVLSVIIILLYIHIYTHSHSSKSTLVITDRIKSRNHNLY